MNFYELITKRQSGRQYDTRLVEPEKIRQCIEAARLAPSACNAQPWKFIVVDEPELKNPLASAGKEYTLMDIGIAATHFSLQATDLGLGTCIIGWLDEKKVQKLLQIPNKKRIPLLLTVGYSTNEIRKKQRKELNIIYGANKY